MAPLMLSSLSDYDLNFASSLLFASLAVRKFVTSIITVHSHTCPHMYMYMHVHLPSLTLHTCISNQQQDVHL